MKIITKKLRYIYWLSAHQQYRRFGENGDNGVYVLTIFILSLLFFTLSSIRVWLWGNIGLNEIFIFDFKFLFKLFFVAIALLTYYIVRKMTKSIPIKNNIEFYSITNKKRIFDTIVLYVLCFFYSNGIFTNSIVGKRAMFQSY